MSALPIYSPLEISKAVSTHSIALGFIKNLDGNFEFVLPCEGSVRVPYVMSLVNNGPNPELGKRVLDFILSDKGQAIWTNAYLQPSRPVELPAEVAAKFLPASDYERAVAVDYAAMEKAQSGFGERYLSDVK